MGCVPQFVRLETKLLVFGLGLVFITVVVVLESTGLPYKNVVLSPLSVRSGNDGEKGMSEGSNYADPSYVVVRTARDSEGSDLREEELGQESRVDVNSGYKYDGSDLKLVKGLSDYESSSEEFVAQVNNTLSQNVEFSSDGSDEEKFRKSDEAYLSEKDQKSDDKDDRLQMDRAGIRESRFVSPSPVIAPNNLAYPRESDAHVTSKDKPNQTNISSAGKQTAERLSEDEKAVSLRSGRVISNNNPKMTGDHMTRRNRVQKPISISQMRNLLLQNRASSSLSRSHPPSVRDRELLYAKLQVENAPIVKKIGELDASLFQNVSMFKKSYELMERILKVYVYGEGLKPIFHQPSLKGIYASEGWFMKLMEGNKQFVVKDPRKAHLFYLPFSSKVLRYTLDRNDLSNFLGSYAKMIATKYPFWNRTGGANHFLVACHDWAPQLTIHHMGTCVRALCNANVAKDFKIGKDVSLPVTYVRVMEDPLKGLGGKAPSRRPILAFFAGNMHGYLRSRLLKYWENKDPAMKIFGPLGLNNSGNMSYTQYMKSSKYCICARGYEVHTPRVVEAIFYECVPVIISDNYVPPFFEVLNWEAFSVFVEEKDIPNLKSILTSIPEKRYRRLQQRVKKVQQHFLWHSKPVKYDIFHMTLHSIWYNRMFQI